MFLDSRREDKRFCTEWWQALPEFPSLQLNNTSIAACLFFATGICLPSRCIAMNVYSGSAIPAFTRHVTI
jgi:hypothetical protein